MIPTKEGRLWAKETMMMMEELVKERLSKFSPPDHGLMFKQIIESDIHGSEGGFATSGIKFTIEIRHDPVEMEGDLTE